ncbi:hypothetical protein ACNJX9_31425 [Bradyrhizobium sp. DASA03076]|uniref:hypothetical protein n=1 Tax=Bradyrhizobium sp. BLXBL-03 TaxID=3395916 RepID=UPI003F6FF3E0
MFGLAGVIWSAVTLPAFRSAAPAKDVTARILVDDRFKSRTLSDLLTSMKASSEPVVQRSDLPRAEALVRLLIAEEPIERKGPDQVDRDVAAADERLKFALALNPADSFLWLMLYSVAARNGLDYASIRFLHQSYGSARLEGWIALRRNRLALAIFPMLSEAMRQNVVSEFAALVDSNFIDVAAANLAGVGWPQREVLLRGLTQVDVISREALAKRLARDGLMANVPGVDVDERLWRQ